MAVDMFLILDQIKGESRDDVYKDQIHVESFSWGISQQGAGHTGSGSGAGKASFQDLHIQKYFDKSTPALQLHCSNGKHIKEGKLVVRKMGEKPLDYFVLEMKQILVSSIQHGGSGHGDMITEGLSLNFAWFKETYTLQNEDGSKGASLPYGWDIAKNAAAA